MDKCKDMIVETKYNNPARQLDLKLFQEDNKQSKLNKTLEILRELELTDPKQIKKLYNYKITGIMEN